MLEVRTAGRPSARCRCRPADLPGLRSHPSRATVARATRASRADARPPSHGGRWPSTRRAMRCPCGARVQPARYIAHRRGDRCPSRPMPCPDDCARCGSARWPCLTCVLGPWVQRRGLAFVARVTELPIVSVRREVYWWRKRWLWQGPLRIRTKAQAARYRHIPRVARMLATSRARLK